MLPAVPKGRHPLEQKASSSITERQYGGRERFRILNIFRTIYFFLERWYLFKTVGINTQTHVWAPYFWGQK